MPRRKVGLFLSKNQQSKKLFNSLLSIKNLDTIQCVIDQKIDKRALEKDFLEKDVREKDQVIEAFTKRMLGNLHGHEYILREAFKRK